MNSHEPGTPTIRVCSHPQDDGGPGWVSALLRHLETHLCAAAGAADAVTFQQAADMAPGTPGPLLVVLSRAAATDPRWVEVVQSHLVGIPDPAEARRLCLVVEREPVPPELRPPSLKDLAGHRFWVQEGDVARTLDAGIPEDRAAYFDRVGDLGRTLTRGLRPRASSVPAAALPPQAGQWTHDVFLSYNWADKPAVKELATRLKVAGIKPWVDDWELQPGVSFHDGLDKAMGACPCALVFYGAAGVGRNQDLEIKALTAEHADRGMPVIPVLLPGSPPDPPVPRLLRTNTWVDLRTPTPEGLDRLFYGITGRHMDARTPVFVAQTSPGLEPLRADVARYLEYKGYRILPEGLLPDDGDGFRAAIQEVVDTGVVFVQLLDDEPGPGPVGDLSFAELQVQAARRERRPIFQWRSPGLDLSSVKDPAWLETLDGPDVRAMDLESFKREVVDGLEEALRRDQHVADRGLEEADGFVFINAREEDIGLVEELCALLSEAGYDFDVCQPEVDDPEDIRQNLEECSDFILINGADAGWLKRQLRLVRRLLPARETPIRSKILLEAPPEDKKQALIKVGAMQIVDCRSGFDREQIQGLIKSLGVEGGA